MRYLLHFWGCWVAAPDENCQPLAHTGLGRTRNALSEFHAITTEMPSDLALDAHATPLTAMLVQVLYGVWDPSPLDSRSPPDTSFQNILQKMHLSTLSSLLTALAFLAVPSHTSPMPFSEHKLEEINALRAEGVSEVSRLSSKMITSHYPPILPFNSATLHNLAQCHNLRCLRLVGGNSSTLPPATDPSRRCIPCESTAISGSPLDRGSRCYWGRNASRVQACTG